MTMTTTSNDKNKISVQYSEKYYFNYESSLSLKTVSNDANLEN